MTQRQGCFPWKDRHGMWSSINTRGSINTWHLETWHRDNSQQTQGAGKWELSLGSAYPSICCWFFRPVFPRSCTQTQLRGTQVSFLLLYLAKPSEMCGQKHRELCETAGLIFHTSAPKSKVPIIYCRQKLKFIRSNVSPGQTQLLFQPDMNEHTSTPQASGQVQMQGQREWLQNLSWLEEKWHPPDLALVVPTTFYWCSSLVWAFFFCNSY